MQGIWKTRKKSTAATTTKGAAVTLLSVAMVSFVPGWVGYKGSVSMSSSMDFLSSLLSPCVVVCLGGIVTTFGVVDGRGFASFGVLVLVKLTSALTRPLRIRRPTDSLHWEGSSK